MEPVFQPKMVKLARKLVKFSRALCPCTRLNTPPSYYLRNCTFENNFATAAAGAMVTAGQARVFFENAVFTNVRQ